MVLIFYASCTPGKDGFQFTMSCLVLHGQLNHSVSSKAFRTAVNITLAAAGIAARNYFPNPEGWLLQYNGQWQFAHVRCLYVSMATKNLCSKRP